MKVNKVINIIIFIFTLFIIAIIAYFSRYCTFWADDLGYTFGYTELSAFDTLNPFSPNSAFQMHGGGYFCSFLTGFFNLTLPQFLNIHPADFISFYMGIIKGIIAALTCYIVSCFINVENKDKKIGFFAYLFVGIYLIYGIYCGKSYILSASHSFFRYFIPYLIFAVYIFYLYKTVILKEKINGLYVFLMSLCAFYLGTSVEIIMYSLLLMVFIIFFSNIFIKKFSIQSSFTIDKGFIIPNLVLIISTILYTGSPGFAIVASDRGLFNIHLTLSDLKDFSIAYLQNCVYNNWFILLISVILIFLLIYRKKEPNKVLFIFMLLFSCFMVMYSLVLCGKTFLQNDNYWLAHANIQILFRMLILIPFLLALGTFLNENYKYIEQIFIGFFSISSIILVLLMFNCKDINPYLKDGSLIAKAQITNYAVEKIYRFFLLNNNDIYLPESIKNVPEYYQDNFLWLREYEKSKDDDCTINSFLNKNYMLLIYKETNVQEKGYCFSNDAIERYYKEGGSFSEQELKNLKFSELFDKEFILNKKNKNTDIISPDRLQKEYLYNGM